jgi:hypothetical protein
MHQSPNVMVETGVVYAWNISLQFLKDPENTSSKHLNFPIMDIKVYMHHYA